jgi:hypothetical protein
MKWWPKGGKPLAFGCNGLLGSFLKLESKSFRAWNRTVDTKSNRPRRGGNNCCFCQF